MAKYTTETLEGLDRRTFVKSLMTLGVSASTAAGMSHETLAKLTDDPKEEVPRLGWWEFSNRDAVIEGSEPPEPEPVYYTIPREQWRQVQGPKVAAQKVSKRFEDPNISAAVQRTSNSQLGVVVHYTKRSDGSELTREPDRSLESVRREVPDAVDATLDEGFQETTVKDIPVTVEEHVQTEELRDCDEDAPSECYFDQHYRPIVGGCEAGGYSNSGCAWTLGSPAYSSRLEEYVMTTAAHCVDWEKDHAVYQTSGGDYLGSSEDYTSDEGDGAVVQVFEGDDDDYVTMGIADGSGSYEWGVAGMVGKDRIDDLLSSGKDIYVQGRRTGRNSGPLEFHDSTRDDPRVGYLISTDGGDSGSPIFELKDGYAYTIGVHAWGYCFDGTKGGGGNTMYFLEDELNLSWSQTI